MLLKYVQAHVQFEAGVCSSLFPLSLGVGSGSIVTAFGHVFSVIICWEATPHRFFVILGLICTRDLLPLALRLFYELVVVFWFDRGRFDYLYAKCLFAQDIWLNDIYVYILFFIALRALLFGLLSAATLNYFISQRLLLCYLSTWVLSKSHS